jgi:hypothetical protein
MLVNHHTQYKFDTEMESAAEATDKKDNAGGVGPVLSLAHEQQQRSMSTSGKDQVPAVKDLPPLPESPFEKTFGDAESPIQKRP